MYESYNLKDNANYDEVSAKLTYIRRLLKTKAGREAVSREVRRKWL